jgi:signal transduction histidine kinase
LRQRLDTVEKRAGVEARLLVEELAELPAPVAEGLYRIAQEALNNAVKHAQATSVTVYLRSEGKGIALEVVDNGQGFDPNKLADTGGLGLVNMKERARQLNGSLEINSVPGVGTSLKVKVEVS